MFVLRRGTKRAESAKELSAKHDEAGLTGTLRSNDADGSENVIKIIGLISKTTTLHVHHTFCTFFSRFCTTTT